MICPSPGLENEGYKESAWPQKEDDNMEGEPFVNQTYFHPFHMIGLLPQYK